MAPLIVAGVDPGTTRIGYAVVSQQINGAELLSAETITISGRSTVAERLGALREALRERLSRDKPHAVAVEKLYFSKNVKTALAVAEARGIILLTASDLVPSIWEYAPLEVKVAVAGYGRADKNQVRRAVRTLLPHASLPSGDDAIDAIAIALTAIYTKRPAA